MNVQRVSDMLVLYNVTVMLHDRPLPASHVTAAAPVCYMDIFAKHQWHCPPGLS
jgi:hypothetical protein